MIDFELWHNPRCSKSRRAKDLLEEAGVPHRVRRYLEDPPSSEHLGRVLAAMGVEPWDSARSHEPLATELGLPGWSHDRQRWIDTLVTYPILIERPVLI
jgi:arsenate reductase